MSDAPTLALPSLVRVIGSFSARGGAPGGRKEGSYVWISDKSLVRTSNTHWDNCESQTPSPFRVPNRHTAQAARGSDSTLLRMGTQTVARTKSAV